MQTTDTAQQVLTGIDAVAAGHVTLPSEARIGLVTNRAVRTRDGTWTGDALQSAGYRIAALLTPEHGLDAAAAAGAHVPHSQTGDVLVLSLYGADRGPVEEAVPGLDLLVIDLPDVGVRYYTYPWTAREVLRLAARHEKPVTILDRPNPLGGVRIEGNLPDEGVDSAVCSSPVCIRHGLTLGELERWNQVAFEIDVELTVVPVEGWRREMYGDQTGLPFVPASPNLPSFDAVLLYPGTCLIEGTNISEGRGTDAPFQLLGAPFVDPDTLARDLKQSPLLAGATVSEAHFTPNTSKWAGEECHGVRIEVRDRDALYPVAAGAALIAALHRFSGFEFRTRQFDLLAGTDRLRAALERGTSPEEIVASWQTDEQRFQRARQDVLLYGG